MNHTACGTFTVILTAQQSAAEHGVNLSRLRLQKTFSGDLTGTSEGEMLSAVSNTPGSAGYVAIERVHGSLHGRHGSFVFQHSGHMDQGGQQLDIRVVADSASGDLLGLRGDFRLTIDAGVHHYQFAYSLPD